MRENGWRTSARGRDRESLSLEEERETHHHHVGLLSINKDTYDIRAVGVEMGLIAKWT